MRIAVDDLCLGLDQFLTTLACLWRYGLVSTDAAGHHAAYARPSG